MLLDGRREQTTEGGLWSLREGGQEICLENRVRVERTRRGGIHLRGGDRENGAGGGSTRGKMGMASRGQMGHPVPCKRYR